MFYKVNRVDRSLCFVLMPFRQNFKPVYDKLKEVVVNEHGLICVRADDICSTGIIIEEIWSNICQAQIVIADVTERNANVFYELGLAHAIGKNVIILAQRANDIPFDIKQHRVIIYKLDSLDALEMKLSKTIEKTKWKKPEIKQWIATNRKGLQVGLSTPFHGIIVDDTPIIAVGRIVGLPETDLRFNIQGWVITNKKYQQGSGWIDTDGYWMINEIHLGATTHQVYFRIYDESDRVIATTKQITVTKRASG